MRRAPALAGEAVERPFLMGRMGRIAHRADPKAARRIAAAVVHAVMWQIALRAGQQLTPARCELVAVDARLQRRQDDALALAEREGADRFAHGPGPVLAAGWVEAVEVTRIDVDPIKALAALAPDRAFAKFDPQIEHAIDGRFRHEESFLGMSSVR